MTTNPTQPIAPSEAAPLPSLLRTFREAVLGDQARDFTKGPVRLAVFMLAVPMVLEQLMESVFGVVDILVASKLGADAVATVGLTEAFMTIIYAVSLGVSIGAGAMIARRIGEKDNDGAARTAAQVLLLGLAASLALGLAAVLTAPTLLSLMGASDGVLANVRFTQVMLGCNASVVMLFLVNAVLRSTGDAATAMRVLWFANGINIVLAPALVFGWGPCPRLGLVGAAIGTTIGRSAGALFALSRLLRTGSRIQLLRRHFAPDAALMMRVINLSGAATVQVLIGMASWIVLTRIVSDFGSEALAGYTIAVRIVTFALLPALGLANAAATMVGQALGAQKPERATQAVWTSAKYAAACLGSVGALFLLSAEPIVAVFSTNPVVAGHAVSALRTLAAGFLFYGYGMVVSQSFNGAGDTRTPTRLNFLIFWVLELPLAWLLSNTLEMGPQGVFMAITFAFSTLAIAASVIFRRGLWKTRVV